MGTVRILADSACDIPDAELKRLAIGLVSLTIRFGDEEFVDRVTMDSAAFWRRCQSSPSLPETAAPSPGAFVAAFDQCCDEGATGIIVVTISGALSATYQSALVGAASYTRVPVHVVDSRAVSMAQGFIAMELAERALDGASLADLVALSDLLVPRVGVVAMLATLDHLIKGGRIGGAKALLGQVLAVKPLLRLENGVVAEAGRQRTTAKALRALIDEVVKHQPLARLCIVHANSPELAAVQSLVAGIAVEHPVLIADIGSTVGTHGGPGLIGLTWLEAGRTAR